MSAKTTEPQNWPAGRLLSRFSPFRVSDRGASEDVPVGRRRPRHGPLVGGGVAGRALRGEQRVAPRDTVRAAAGRVRPRRMRRRVAAPRPAAVPARGSGVAAAEGGADGVVVEVDVALRVDGLVGGGAHQLRAQEVLAAVRKNSSLVVERSDHKSIKKVLTAIGSTSMKSAAIS